MGKAKFLAGWGYSAPEVPPVPGVSKFTSSPPKRATRVLQGLGFRETLILCCAHRASSFRRSLVHFRREISCPNHIAEHSATSSRHSAARMLDSRPSKPSRHSDPGTKKANSKPLKTLKPYYGLGFRVWALFLEFRAEFVHRCVVCVRTRGLPSIRVKCEVLNTRTYRQTSFQNMSR